MCGEWSVSKAQILYVEKGVDMMTTLSRFKIFLGVFLASFIIVLAIGNVLNLLLCLISLQVALNVSYYVVPAAAIISLVVALLEPIGSFQYEILSKDVDTEEKSVL